jgi:hypothetical protein
MDEVKEVTVKIKGEEKNLKQKFLIYDDFAISENDPIISECIRTVRNEFKGEIESVRVSVLLVVQ